MTSPLSAVLSEQTFTKMGMAWLQAQGGEAEAAWSAHAVALGRPGVPWAMALYEASDGQVLGDSLDTCRHTLMQALEAGAEVGGCGPDGRTVLHLAAKACRPHHVQALLEAGVPVEGPLPEGPRVLHEVNPWRWDLGGWSVRRLLIEAGASVAATANRRGLLNEWIDQAQNTHRDGHAKALALLELMVGPAYDAAWEAGEDWSTSSVVFNVKVSPLARVLACGFQPADPLYGLSHRLRARWERSRLDEQVPSSRPAQDPSSRL